MELKKLIHQELLSAEQYNLFDLRWIAQRQGNRRVSRSRFYVWLEACLIDPSKKVFDRRDLEKLTYFARNLNYFGSVSVAANRLYADLENRPWKYNFEKQKEETIDAYTRREDAA